MNAKGCFGNIVIKGVPKLMGQGAGTGIFRQRQYPFMGGVVRLDTFLTAETKVQIQGLSKSNGVRRQLEYKSQVRQRIKYQIGSQRDSSALTHLPTRTLAKPNCCLISRKLTCSSKR